MIEQQSRLPPPPLGSSGAHFSACGLYRWSLWRCWDVGLPRVVFIGLNPSTADATQDDPTIRRCKGFARDLGFGSLTMVNLFAWRATVPTALFDAPDPIGKHNNMTLLTEAKRAQLVIAAWGAWPAAETRGAAVAQFLGEMGIELQALALTAGGQPRHPLYLKRGLKPQPWRMP